MRSFGFASAFIGAAIALSGFSVLAGAYVALLGMFLYKPDQDENGVDWGYG